jgi:hypothetical protein
MWVDCCRSLLDLVVVVVVVVVDDVAAVIGIIIIIIIIIIMAIVKTAEMCVIRYRWTYVLECPVASVTS